MPGRAKTFSPFLLWLWFLFTLLCAPPPSHSGTTFYKYVDERGSVTYTDRLEKVPARYRKQVEVLELDSPPRTLSDPIQTETQSRQETTRSSSSWMTWLASLQIPLPSRFQLGVGLLAGVLVFGTIAILRYCSNPLVKLALKGFIVLIVIGSAYVLYFFSLSDRLSAATGKRSQSTLTGQDIITGIRDGMTAATETLRRTAVEPLMAPVHKAEDLTIGEANRTAERANQANRDLRKRLDAIDQAAQSPP